MKRTDLIDQLATYILTLAPGHPSRVAVDGVDAAGKTSLADELADALASQARQIVRVSVDDFLNLKHIRRRQGHYSPQGFYEDSYNYPALINDLLKPLSPGGSRHYRRSVYDAESDKPLNLPFRTAAEDVILILDGIFLLRPELVRYWDLTIFLSCDFEVTRARGTRRDTDLFGSFTEAENRYHKRYIPGQQLYFQEAHPLDNAQIVIDNNILEEPFFIRFPGIT
jgi:uridine kinase